MTDNYRYEILQVHTGSTPSLLLQGVETLSLHDSRHVDNALALPRWLKEQPTVTWINALELTQAVAT